MQFGDETGWDLENDWSRYWILDPEVTFLNHGSFGACPAPILAEQARLRAELESQPVRFLARQYEARLDAARAAVADFVGADSEDLVFVPNATTGVNAVLQSLRFAPGDELVVTDHEYNASRNVLDFVAARDGARVVVATIPFPLESPARVVEAILDRVTGNTKLVLLDHITSQTGLVLPVAEVNEALVERGIDLLVDGAHGPGMVPLDLRKLGAAYYTGNCHKWLCAPKGAAILHVRRDRQDQIRPPIISHGANSRRTDRSRYQLEFGWMGTDDPTAYLVVPAAMQFLGSLLPGGLPELMARNRALVLAARQLLCETLHIPPPCLDEMIGSLATLPLPSAEVDPTAGTTPPVSDHDGLQEVLEEEYGIITPVIYWPAWPRRVVRIAAQAHNSLGQYRRLAGMLAKIL
ncbi:MAG: aminotransferase class V-fold PLP-dependent enzyme [bacterium]